jgi:hypothetical protein
MASRGKKIATANKALADMSKGKTSQKMLRLIAEAKANVGKQNRRTAGAQLAPFGGVSEISAAPVSLGNTIRSVKQTVMPHSGGVRVVGRDFVQAVGGTSVAFSNWCLQGGVSLSPIALNASGLRGFFQTYEQYKWNRVNAHYVTSSPTSIAGDILIVYHRNHGGPKVNHLSANFLSYALSTESALIGPQWTNHSVEILSGNGTLLNTDVLNVEDVQHQADGELLVYTKNTTNGTSPDQPGYILIDYDITFTGRMLNSRVQTLPSGIFKWFPTALAQGGAVAAADQVSLDIGTANTYTGTAAQLPPGTVPGTVFQVVFDTQNATFGGTLTVGTLSTMWSVNYGFTGTGGTSAPILAPYAIATGTTVYAVYRGSNVFSMYPSYDAVFAGNTLRWTVSSAGQAFTTAAIMCCVGSINEIFQQANIG